MTMTRKAKAAPPTPDDHKPCDVDVTVGRAVFHDGEQREGLVHGVPKRLALAWLAAGHVRIVYEPNP